MRLTDTSTNGLTSTRVASFDVTQPDNYTRQGDILNPDMAAGVTTFSLPLRLDSSGQPQCGTYNIVMTVRNAGYDDTTFTRNWVSQYIPVTIVINEEFDVFTPNLSVGDATTYAVSNYNNTPVTRAWSVSSTPTGTLTGSGATLSLIFNGSYYDANYSVSLTSSLLYTHQVYTWFTVNETVSKSYNTYAKTPPSVDTLVSNITSLKNELENAINKCRERGVVQADLEWAQVLYTHILDKILTNQTTGIYQDLKDLLAVLNNYQIPAYTPTNQPIPTYDLSSYLSSAIWGNIGGNIINQTDLVNYINTVVTSQSFASNIGDGNNITYTINHGLNSKDVVVDLYEISTGETVYADITRPTVNTVVVSFATAPTTNQYRVIIIK